MNFTLGNNWDILGAKSVLNLTHIATPPPAKTWVFVGEHADSINNGLFTVFMNESKWDDLPASYHNGACGFACADGHSEIKKWLDRPTWKPVEYDNSLGWGTPLSASERRDHGWLQERTAGKK